MAKIRVAGTIRLARRNGRRAHGRHRGDRANCFHPKTIWSNYNVCRKFVCFSLHFSLIFAASASMLNKTEIFSLFLPPHWLLVRPRPSSRENNNLEDFDNWQSQISSEEDNSPTQMNNCRKFIDKAPLVKRLSINLLRSTEEYRPLLCSSVLLHKTKASIAKTYLSTSSTQLPSAADGYADDQQFHDADEMISSKFGDSCRKSLTSMLDNRRRDYHEIDYRRNFGLRETSSGKYIIVLAPSHWVSGRAEIYSLPTTVFVYPQPIRARKCSSMRNRSGSADWA